MELFILTIFLVLLTIAFFMCYILFRNDLVFNARIKLLDDISLLAQKDIEAGRQWYWRYRAFEKYPYIKMVWQLWKFKWELHEILS